ncbi:MAG: hypothetical protein Q7T08_08395 [Devosia sp.]|nr:hypothetical protein [Devosia sp.]
MIFRSTVLAVTAAFALLAFVPTAARADPMQPTPAEVDSVVDVLQFRSDMIADPTKAIATFAADAAVSELKAIAAQMQEAGSGDAGWRYLLGTAVFTRAGLDKPQALVVFYNPWVDTALFTIWEAQSEGRRIVEAEWVPGDLVRQANAEFDPQPLWLRGEGYRPEALVDEITTTVQAIETRVGDDSIDAWRETLGITKASVYRRLIAPIIAARLYEAQMRLKALAVPTEGEDPLLVPLRHAVADLITTVSTKGFVAPLAEAQDTTASMREALSQINPLTMMELAPVAFVAGDGFATVFLASAGTADFAISARYIEKNSAYKLEQLEYLPYAAIYWASLNEPAAVKRK